jgi:uncharacterized protein (TIGR02594 family)
MPNDTKPAAKVKAPAKAPAATVKSVGVKWMAIAHGYMGVRELAGAANNPVIAKFFAEAGHAEVKTDATPWCSAFVGACLAEAGQPNTGTLWALHYAKYGQKLAGPMVGAIGVKSRHGGGHVFFVAGFDQTYVYSLGGNQNDQVCISRIRRDQILAYRWPPGVAIPGKSAAGTATASVANAREA